MDLLDTDGTFIKTLSAVGLSGWVHPKRGPGRGGFVVPDDHADIADLQDGRIVKVSDDFGWVVERPGRVISAPEGERLVQVAGPGVLAKLGVRDRFEAVVEGDGLSGLKVFGWPTLGYDRTGWTEGLFSFGTVADPDERLPRLAQVANGEDGWPDLGAEWVWTRDLTIDGDRAFHPAGTVYMVRTLEHETRTYEGPARVFLSCTNRGDVWWDHQHVRSFAGARNVVSFDVEIIDGQHHIIGVKVEKDDHPGWQWDPGLFRMSIIELTNEGELGRVLYRSYTDAVTSATPSPGPWFMLDYQEPAGVTYGQVMRVLIAEAQARGALAGVSHTFTDALDSDGAAWTVSYPIKAYRDGEQVGDVCLQAAQDFRADCQMTPGLVLNLYDDMGTDLSGSVELTTGTDRFGGKVTVRTQPVRANWFRVQVDGEVGWRGAGTPRREAGVTFGTAGSEDEVSSGVDELASELAGREFMSVDMLDVSDFTVADTISAWNGTAYVDWQVTQIAGTQLPGGDEYQVDLERDL